MRAGLVALLVAATCGCGGAEFTVATGTSNDAGWNDATIGANDATTGANDATTDAVKPLDGPSPAHDSGGVVPDGGRDASDGGGSDAGDAGVFRCATATDPTIVFCSDFDEQATAPWNWQVSLTNNNKGTNAVDTTNYVSSPNGFAASVPVLLPTDQATFASLQQQLTLPSGTSHAAYGFFAFTKQVDSVTSDSFPIARIVAGQGTGSLFLDLILAKTGLSLQQSSTGSDGGTQTETTPVAGGALPASTWTHIEMGLDRSASPGTVTIRINGVVELNALPTIVTPSSQALEVDLGILDVVPVTGGTNALTFDNAILRAY